MGVIAAQFPWASGPLSYPLRSGVGASAVFLKGNRLTAWGSKGEALLGGSLLRSERLVPNVFSALRKKGTAHRSPAESDVGSMRGQPETSFFFPIDIKQNPCLGPPFLVTKKRGKRSVGGIPRTPGEFIF